MLHTDKQTNRQTDKQINAGKNIYLLAEVNNIYYYKYVVIAVQYMLMFNGLFIYFFLQLTISPNTLP